MTTPRAPARDPFGDALRGAAILGVVAIHGLDTLLPPRAYEAVALYSRWCVPAFVFLTAFYAARALATAPGRSPWAWSLARLRQLLWPFAAYSALYLALSLVLNPPPHGITAMKLMTTYLGGYGWPGQYYFIVLFQLIPLIAWLARAGVSGRRAAAIWLGGLLLYAVVPQAWRAWPVLDKLADRPFWYWLPYAALGVWAARPGALAGLHRCRPAWLTPRRAGWLALAAPLLIVMAGPGADAGLAPGHGSPYLRPCVLVAATAVLAFSHIAVQGLGLGLSAWRWLMHLGRHSLIVFCLNPAFILLGRFALQAWPAPAALPAASPAALGIAMAPGFIALVIGASLLAGRLLRSVGLGRLAG